MVFSIIVTIIAFGVMIIIHEAGHFFTAKRFGVTVHEFSVGMGPLLWSREKGGTQYSLRALPLGGYVKLEGEDESSDDPKAFSNIAPLKRVMILAAGAAMNVLLGFLCFVVILSATQNINTTRIYAVSENSAAERAGLEAGDEIIKLNGSRVYMRADMDLFMLDPPDEIRVAYRRGGERRECVLKPMEEGTRRILGVVLLSKKPNALEVVQYAYYNTRYVVKAVFFSLKQLFTGRAGIRDLSGPVGIVKVVDDAASEAAEVPASSGGGMRLVILTVLNLFAMISVNLGVFNLLPFPALDGGSIIFALIELVTRRKQNPDILGYINFAGLVIILGLGIFVMGSDILRIFGR